MNAELFGIFNNFFFFFLHKCIKTFHHTGAQIISHRFISKAEMSKHNFTLENHDAQRGAILPIQETQLITT